MNQPRAARRPSRRPFPRLFTRSVVAAAAHVTLISAAVGVLVVAPEAAYAQAATRAYDIPAGSLEQALSRFGSASSILLSFSADLTQGIVTGSSDDSADFFFTAGGDEPIGGADAPAGGPGGDVGGGPAGEPGGN